MMGRPQSAGLIGALAVSAILPYLLDLGYRAGDIEVITISAATAVLGIAAGWMLAGRPRANHLLISFMVYWIVDAYFANSTPMVVVASTAAVMTFATLQSRFAVNVPPMLIAFCFFWVVSNLLSAQRDLISPVLNASTSQPNTGTRALPLLVHFILDEQMSPTALPETIPRGGHPASQMVDDYVSRGFDMYTEVHSISHLTRYALGNLFSLRNDSGNSLEGEGEFSWQIRNNDYLELLRTKGYEVTVVQSNYLRVCNDQPDLNCHTYSRANNGHTYATSIKSIPIRIKLALMDLHTHLFGSQRLGGVFVYGIVMRGLQSLDDSLQWETYFLQPTAMLDVLDQISEVLNDAQSGQAYVVHLLFPHLPYILDRNCAVNDPRVWTQRGGANSVPNSVKSIYPAYWDQVACAHSRMMRIVDKLNKSGAGAIIIVHGDHGARITLDDPAGESEEDLLQTMYAIRRPGSTGKIIANDVILQELFKSMVESLFQKPDSAAAPRNAAVICRICDTSSPRRSVTLPIAATGNID